MYGVWLLSYPYGWCYVSSGARVTRSAPLADCEEALKNFRESYPDTPYEIRLHSPECEGRWYGDCCKSVSVEEQYQ